MTAFLTLDDVNVTNKTVLVRVDINVPMQGGQVTDNSRIRRIAPTVHYLLKKKAKVVLLSHFDRPEGKFVPSMSLAALVDEVAAVIGKPVQFGVDCVGPSAQEAVKKLKSGEVLLLENLRFHAEEEKGNPHFARDLASLGDIFVNDAFSCSHRAHASITGINAHLPSVAGKLMEEEVNVLSTIFTGAKKPIAAIVGGSKVSTKISLLKNLTKTMDVLAIGGAMANTFLYAQGYSVGKSKCEKDMKATALAILKAAVKNGCRIVLPTDLIVVSEFKTQADCQVVDVDSIPAEGMATDVGPASIELFSQAINECNTVVWNGPVGAFEVTPFDCSTVTLARHIAKRTGKKQLRSIAGGGDTVAALSHAGMIHNFSYISTAGGAFLEWMEGKELPGVAALMKQGKAKKVKVTK